MARLDTLKRWIATLWHTDRPLTATAAVMLAVLVVAATGMVLDPRIIGGAPAWLKPAKFAASIAIYTGTLAWLFTFLPDRPRTRRVAGVVTAATLILEEIIIALQAWRGTTSHFNVGTTLDAALWSAMGTAIVVQTLVSIWIAIALWRQRFADRALGWAVRLGLVISIIGAGTGGLMTQPTAAQLAEARVTKRLPIAGAHTVGAPDGGTGLPVTKWSTTHGDLRVPHFIGLHAVQILPIVVFLVGSRRWPEATRVRLTLTAAASYVVLFGLLLWQALRGQALIAPDATMLAALALWSVATATAAGLAVSRRRPVRVHATV